MFDQPSMLEHMTGMMAYDNFLTYAMYVGIPFALAFYYLRKKRGTRIGFNLWTIIIIGLILRVPIMEQAFWYDESFTSAIAQVPWADFMIAVQGDVHPPGYYFIVRIVTEIFGHNDIAMRMPALISSLGLIVTMYHIGKAYGGERIGKWVALITAILPAAIYYASEARYPAFLALGLSIAYIGIQRKKFWLFSVPLAIVAFTHINGWIYIVIMAGVWLLSHRSLRALVLPFSSMGLWFPIAVTQASDVADGFWLPQWSGWQHISTMTVGVRFDSPNVALLPIAITTALIGVSIWQWRKKADVAWLAVVVLVPLAQWLVGVVWHPIYLPRTLLFSALLLIVPVAQFLEDEAHRIIPIVALVCVFAAYLSMSLKDRNLDADTAIHACDGYETIYASNVHTGIIARHFSDSQVIVYEHGNSTAQQLPRESQEAIFDSVGNIFDYRSQDVCVVSQISVFNSEREIQHLIDIVETFDAEHLIIGDQEKLGYYLILYVTTGEQIQ
ncbi:MAG: glycosyltransferase family 39 protein [Chloroflexota bacterium]